MTIDGEDLTIFAVILGVLGTIFSKIWNLFKKSSKIDDNEKAIQRLEEALEYLKDKEIKNLDDKIVAFQAALSDIQQSLVKEMNRLHEDILKMFIKVKDRDAE